MTSTPVLENTEADRRFIDVATLKRFVKPCPVRWLAAVAVEFAVIFAAMYAFERWAHPWLWFPAAFLIGTRQHSLGILAHEATHYLVSRRRWLNDLLGNLFAAYPITYPVQGYRTAHLAHHRWLDTERDPERASVDFFPGEWTFPMGRTRFFGILATDVVGMFRTHTKELLRYIWQVPGGNGPHIAGVLLYHGAIVAAAVYTHHFWTYLFLWVVPLFTIAPMCFRIRTAAEHSAVASGERFRRAFVDTVATTRTTIGGPVTGFLFAPNNMSFHLEHHLYPMVPVFQLRALHEHLMKNPAYAAKARVTDGYDGLLRELTTT